MRKLFIAISGFYLILAALMSVVMVFTKPLPLIDKVIGSMNAGPSLNLIFVMTYILWLTVTGCGIILKKNWARYSLFIISLGAIFIGFFGCIGVLFSSVPITAKVPIQSFKLTSILSMAFFLILIPIIFLIFFNSRLTKELFLFKGKKSKVTRRPFGITLLAIVTLLGAFSSFIYIFIPVLNTVSFIGTLNFSGYSQRIFCVLLTLLNLYIAIGLLRMRRNVWVIYVLFLVFGIMATIVNIFTISEINVLEIMPQSQGSYSVSPVLLYRICGISGLLFSIAILGYVISKRGLFFKTNCISRKST